MITFLGYVFDFLEKIYDLEIINGITLITILIYNLLIISLWVSFTRRG